MERGREGEREKEKERERERELERERKIERAARTETFCNIQARKKKTRNEKISARFL